MRGRGGCGLSCRVLASSPSEGPGLLLSGRVLAYHTKGPGCSVPSTHAQPLSLSLLHTQTDTETELESERWREGGWKGGGRAERDTQ